MRHQPAVVDRIAREAAAEMIVDAALAHIGQGDLDRPLEGLAGRIVRRSLPGTPELPEITGLGEFRRTADATPERIDELREALGDLVDDAGRGALDRKSTRLNSSH